MKKMTFAQMVSNAGEVAKEKYGVEFDVRSVGKGSVVVDVVNGAVSRTMAFKASDGMTTDAMAKAGACYVGAKKELTRTQKQARAMQEATAVRGHGQYGTNPNANQALTA